MRRLLLAAAVAAAVPAAQPASAGTCAGTQGTLVVCVMTESVEVDPRGQAYRDCLYLGPGPCRPFEVLLPTVSSSGCLVLLGGELAPEQYCEESDD